MADDLWNVTDRINTTSITNQLRMIRIALNVVSCSSIIDRMAATYHRIW